MGKKKAAPREDLQVELIPIPRPEPVELPPEPEPEPEAEPEPEPEPFDRPWQDVVDDLDMAFKTVRGTKYTWRGKDFKALKRMAAELKGNSTALIARWSNALRSTHPVIGEVWQLETRLNQFARKGDDGPPRAANACSACNEPAECLTYGQWLCRPHKQAWDATWLPDIGGDWTTPYRDEKSMQEWVFDLRQVS